MTNKDAKALKQRILDCRQNELTKKISIRRIFEIIDYMSEPETPHLEIKKYVCPKCGTIVHEWGIKI